VRLGCYGLNGGKAGTPFCVTVDADGTGPHDLGGLVDGEPVRAGEIVRVVTTGGGGWGDPLEREPELVRHDVIDGKVSPEAAREHYGVVLLAAADGSFDIEAAATAALRVNLRSQRAGETAMIDRGAGFDKMLRGEVKPWVRSG
jgi:N-methylhydantoinase B